MNRITVTRKIAAPVDRVFAVVTDVESLPERDADVVRVEFLSEQRSGAGARFRETRMMKSRETRTELEITELVENERARFVSDAGGTVWDTLYSVRPLESGAGTELRVELDARPYKVLARLAVPFMKGMVRRGMDRHIESLKVHCESLE